MKAAVLNKAGDIPIYQDFPDPVPGQDEQLLFVKAASIKNLDKMRAKGTHYDKYPSFPVVTGVDGVGVLEDGTRVYTGSRKGMMAEKAIVAKQWAVPLPDGLDDVTAAALPNPAVSAWLSLEWKGQLQRADAVLSLNQPYEVIGSALEAEVRQQPFAMVLDYLWGEPAELVLDVLTGQDMTAAASLTRYIQIGEMAGPSIRLNAAALRSSAIELSGQGGGSIPKDMLKKIPTVYLPEIFRLALEGKLRIETEAVDLKDIETAWSREDGLGKRIVLTI